MSHRTIRVTQDGKVIYDGPENRHAQVQSVGGGPRFLGLAADSWFKVIGFVIAGAIFWYRTETFMNSQLKINEYVAAFTQNSDAYHSAKTGQVFKQGYPTAVQMRERLIQPNFKGEA